MIIRMSDKDATLVHKLANSEGVTISDFAHIAVLEEIEDSYDLRELQVTITADGDQRFSIDGILGEL